MRPPVPVRPMTYRSLPLLCAPLLAAPPTRAADPPPTISAERIKADVAFLASDRLEGRGPGTRGEELTTDFIAAEFKKAGLKPAGAGGTYLQPVPLLRVATSPKSALRAAKVKDALEFVAGETSPARARRRRNSRSSRPWRCSSATASRRRNSGGTTTLAWT